MKLSIFFLVFIFSVNIISCVSNDNQRQNPYTNTLHLKPSYLASLDTPNYTKIQWIDTLKNFGTIKEGEEIEIAFRFKNTGDNPLFISEVMATCGCTVPSMPEDPVFSGEESKIKVIYNSRGQHSDVFKTILVTSNTKPFAKNYLTIKGKIIGLKDK